MTTISQLKTETSHAYDCLHGKTIWFIMYIKFVFSLSFLFFSTALETPRMLFKQMTKLFVCINIKIGETKMNTAHYTNVYVITRPKHVTLERDSTKSQLSLIFVPKRSSMSIITINRHRRYRELLKVFQTTC